MKIVKLTNEEFRKWRENIPCVVDAEGLELRIITSDEIGIFRELDKHALAAKRSVSALVEEGTPTERQMHVTVTVDAKTGNVHLARAIGEQKVVVRREAIKAALTKQHGKGFQVRSPGGKFPLTTVRGASAGASQGAVLAAGMVPHPDACQCSGYFGRQPGRHHKACQHNVGAPIDQRAMEDGVVVQTSATVVALPGQAPTMSNPPPAAVATGPKVRFLPSTNPTVAGPPGSVVAAPTAAPAFMTQAKILPPTQVVPSPALAPPPGVKPIIEVAAVLAAPEPPPPPPAPVPISPAECKNECYKWHGHPTGKPDAHHATCMNREVWEQHAKGIEPKVLVDLDTKLVLRAASPEEVAEAAANMGIAKIDDKPYGVVPQSEAFAPAPIVQEAPATAGAGLPIATAGGAPPAAPPAAAPPGPPAG